MNPLLEVMAPFNEPNHQPQSRRDGSVMRVAYLDIHQGRQKKLQAGRTSPLVDMRKLLVEQTSYQQLVAGL